MPPKLRRPRMDATKKAGEKKQSAAATGGSNSAATGTAVNVVDNLETTVKSSPKKTDTGSKVTPEKVVENVSVNGPEEQEEGKKENERVVFQVKRSSKVDQASNVFDGNSSATAPEAPADVETPKNKGALEEVVKSNEIENQEIKNPTSSDISEDFMKVVNLNGETMDWPMEFVQYTKTAPIIAFGRNPFLENFDISELDKQPSDDSENKESKKSQQFLPRSLKLKSATTENQGTKSNDESTVVAAEGCETKKRKKKKKSKRKKKKRSKDGKAVEEGEIDGKDGQKVGEVGDVDESEESKKKKKKRKKKEKGKKKKNKTKTEETESKDDTNKDTKLSDSKGKHKKHKKRKHKEKKNKVDDKSSEKKADEKETPLPQTSENPEECANPDSTGNMDVISTTLNPSTCNPNVSANTGQIATDSSATNTDHGSKGKKHNKRLRDQSAINSTATAEIKETNQTPISSKRRRRNSSKRDTNEADLNSAKEDVSSGKKSQKSSSSVPTRKSAPGALISGHSLVAYSSDEDSTSQPKEETEDSDKKAPSNFLKEKQIKSEPHLSWDTPERESKGSELVRGEAVQKPNSGGKWNRDIPQTVSEVKCTGKSSWDTSDSEVEIPARIPGPTSANALQAVSPKVEKSESAGRISENPSATNTKIEEKTTDNETGRRRRKRRRSTRSSDSSRESRSSDESYSRSRTRSRSHRRRHRRRGGGRRGGRRSSRYRRRSRSSSYSSFSSRSSRSPSSRSYSRSYSRSSRSYSSYTSTSSYSRSGRSRSRSRSSYSSYSSRSYYTSRSRSRSRSSSYRHSSARGRSRRRRYSSKSSPDPRYSSVLSNRRIRQGPNRQVSSAANASVSVGKSGDGADGASQQKQLLNRLRRARDSATSNAVSSNATAVTAAVANSTPNNNSDGVDADEENEKPVFGPHLPDAGSKSGNNDRSDGGKNDSVDSSGAQPSLDIPLPKDRPKLQKPGPGEWCPAMDFGGPPKKKKKMSKTQNQSSGSNGNNGNSSSGAQDIPLPGGPTYIGPQVPVTMAKSLGLDISGVDSKQGSKPHYTTVSSTCTTTNTKTSKKSAVPLTSTANDAGTAKTTMDDSFFIPPDQAEQYKALQHQAKIHAAKQTGEPLPPDVEATVSIAQIPQAGTPTLSVAATPTQTLFAQSDLTTAALLQQHQQQQQQQQQAQIAVMLNAAIQQQQQQQQHQQQQALLAALSQQQSLAQAAAGAQHLVQIPQMLHQGATPLLAKLPQAASGLIHTPTGLVGLHHGLPQAAGLIQTSMALAPSGHLVATPNHHVFHATNPLASNQLTALQAAANPSILAAFGSHSSAGAAAAAAHSVGAAPHIVLPTGQIVRLVKPM